jgi:hypothetical protein
MRDRRGVRRGDAPDQDGWAGDYDMRTRYASAPGGAPAAAERGIAPASDGAGGSSGAKPPG